MHNRFRAHSPLVAGGLAAAFVLSGCAATPPQNAGSGERVDGGTIEYAHQQEPQCVFGGWIEQAYLSYQVIDNLVSLDEDHEVVPWLAESWEESDDGLTWTFILKEGVEFTDGSPLTASVVAYNFDYWLDGGNSTAQVWLDGYYESAEALDDQTLAVHLSRPYPRLADNLTQSYFGIQSQEALETRSAAENCEQPIGSGAFAVEEWNRGENIVLKRNENYTSPPANARHEGPAYVDTINWRFVQDSTTRFAALQSGEVDALYDLSALDWAPAEAAGFALEKYVTPGRPQQLSFNTVEGPFVDENVRKAFAYSLDRRALVETIGQGVIPFEGNGAVSQSTPGYSQKAADTYSQDLDRANALLDEAGWTGEDGDGYRTRNGEPLSVVLPYGTGVITKDGASILQGVQEQAKAVGFQVQLIPLPESELWSGAWSTPDTYDISAGYWTAVTAGIQYINWRQSTEEWPNYNNAAFYNDPELEALILAGNSARTVEEQNAHYQQAQEYIADKAVSIGVYTRLSTLAVSPNLVDVWQEHAQGGPTFYDAYFVE